MSRIQRVGAVGESPLMALGSVSTLLLAELFTGHHRRLKRAGYPAPSTEEGSTMLSLWTGSWIAALAVGIWSGA